MQCGIINKIHKKVLLAIITSNFKDLDLKVMCYVFVHVLQADVIVNENVRCFNCNAHSKRKSI